MTASSLLWAVTNGTLFLGSGAAVSLSLKRLFFGAWRGGSAVIVLALLGISWALALGQLVGAVGWLRPAPLVLCAVGSATVLTLVCRRVSVSEPPTAPRETNQGPTQPGLLIATVILVLGVGAVWTARTVIAVRQGIYDPDSIGYHLPFAAIFAQTGHADPTRFPYPDSPVQFFPANDELLSAIALVLTRSFAFAAVKNLVYAGLVLVAAHTIGKVYDAGVLAVAGTAIVLGLPAVAFSQPGEAMNDSLPLLAIVGGLAVLAHARGRPGAYVLVLTCTGAAFGSKYSTVIPAFGLGALAIWLLRSAVSTKRLHVAVLGALGGLAVGGSWYLRNAITYGNPVPPAAMAIGPFRLRYIDTKGARDSFSVAWYLVHGDAFHQLWRGLGLGLSPLFLPIIAAVSLGAVAGLRSRDGFRQGLSVLAIITGVAYLTLPGSAYGGKGSPLSGFIINLHYAIPALVVSVVSAAIAIGRRRWAWVVPVVGCFVVAASIRPGQRIRFWAPEIGGRRFGLLILVALAGGAVAWMSTRPSLARRARPAAAATTVLAALALLVIILQYPKRTETDAVQRWAASVSPTTIGGWVPAAMLYGPGAQNRVVTFTRERSVDGGPVALDSCPAWMEAIRNARLPYTAVMSNTQWQRWVDADPAFELVAQNEAPAFYRVSVYRMVGEPDPACPGTR